MEDIQKTTSDNGTKVSVKKKVTINKLQVLIGFSILLSMIALAIMQHAKNSNLSLFLITGLSIGYMLQRSRYGFAGGIRRLYVTGDSSLTKALMFMFSITLIITAAIHYGAFLGGAEASFKAAEGAKIIPGTQSVTGTNLATVLGGILFGIGMMLGGGCASGTLTDVGQGEGRAIIVLFFFITGSLWGAHDSTWWQNTVFFVGPKVYLPDLFGYIGTIIVSLSGFLGIYIFSVWYENKRKRENTLMPLKYANWEKPLSKAVKYKFFSKETYHKFFIQRWSYYTGAVLITLMFEVILITSGKSWGVTANFCDIGAWIYQGLGIVDVSNWSYFKDLTSTIDGGFMNDTLSMRNLGIIAGALISSLLAGHYTFEMEFKFRDVIFYAVGGLCMGYGARLSSGCNIGALYSGIANMSLSGWLFMLSLIIGGILGIKLVKKFRVSM